MGKQVTCPPHSDTPIVFRRRLSEFHLKGAFELTHGEMKTSGNGGHILILLVYPLHERYRFKDPMVANTRSHSKLQSFAISHCPNPIVNEPFCNGARETFAIV